MSPRVLPLQILLRMVAGWVNRHQLDLIDYLQEENRVTPDPYTSPALPLILTTHG